MHSEGLALKVRSRGHPSLRIPLLLPPPTPACTLSSCSHHIRLFCVRGVFFLLITSLLSASCALVYSSFVQTNIMNMCLQTFMLNIFCSGIYVWCHKCLSGYHDHSCLIELLMPSPVKTKILSTKRHCQKNVSTLRRMATQMHERVQREAKRWKTEKRQRTDF